MSFIKFETTMLFTIRGAFLNSPCYKFWPKLAGESDSQKTSYSWLIETSQHDNDPSMTPCMDLKIEVWGNQRNWAMDYPNNTSKQNPGSRTLVTRCSWATIFWEIRGNSCAMLLLEFPPNCHCEHHENYIPLGVPKRFIQNKVVQCWLCFLSANYPETETSHRAYAACYLICRIMLLEVFEWLLDDFGRSIGTWISLK